jgi:hypothetical protein
MTERLPRIVAAIAFLIGLVGLGVSLPLLSSVKTSVFFLLGASAWGFLLWRALSAEFMEAFFAGWLWSSVLHLGLLPLSVFIPAILGTKLPVPVLILFMFVLSMAGLFAELRLSTRRSSRQSDDFPEEKEAEQAGAQNP